MAKFASPYQKKQKKLLIILAIVVLAVVLILYFGFKKPSEGPSFISPEEIPLAEEPAGLPGPSPELFPPGEELPLAESPVSLLTEIELDLDFLRNEKFLSLKIFGNIPPKVEEKGRENPFLPY